MRKIVFIWILIHVGFYAKAEGYQIEFRGSVASTIVEKVTVENLTRGTSISLNGSDILHLKGITATNHFTLNESFKIFPNPSKEFCIAEISNTKPGVASIEVLDLTGRIVGNSRFMLTKGKHSFRIEGLNRGLYIIKMNTPEFISVGKIISEGSGSSGLSITHSGTKPLPEEPALKSISSDVTMDFNDGELLKITGFSGNYSTVVMNIPVRSETITFPFVDCTDADGNHYSIVKIGAQYWMAENLKTTRYRNGDPISLITENSEWATTTDGAYCHYDNNPVNTETYGLMYNWKAAVDSRGLAPEGWRVPTYDEWKSTLQAIKDEKPAGGKIKETGTAHWYSPNYGASNTTGFSALPGGFRGVDGGFGNLGYYAYWWSSTAFDSQNSDFIEAAYAHDTVHIYYGGNPNGLSIRCIKEAGGVIEEGSEYLPGEPSAADPKEISENTVSEESNPVSISLPDGTKALVTGHQSSVSVTLSKSGLLSNINELLPPITGMRTTGSTRTIEISGSGDVANIKPIITIPSGEAGSINVETLNVLRVGTVYVNGEAKEQYTAMLPVFIENNGDFKFIDPLFPESVLPDATKSTTIPIVNPNDSTIHQQQAETRWVGNVKYILMSFDKALNWRQPPVLERMVPDSIPIVFSCLRTRYNSLSAQKKEKIMKQPICNIFILVHGHNEEEKDGFKESSCEAPWNYFYKRLVWEALYLEFIDNKNFPQGSTAFYEFIFPTYRPIFSPILKSGFVHKTLGEDLGQLINSEFQTNPQLKAMLDNDMPFNLFFVAHSQGGLVTRAGLRFVDQKILKNLKKVITWGSPHQGAGLISLRYALTVGHDLVLDGYKFPMQNIGQSGKYQSEVAGLAMDAPGIRDFRWDASKKDMLRFGELLQENTTTLNEFQDTELPDGKLFFSENLSIFNNEEGSFLSGLLNDKYLFYETTTSKKASKELSWDIFNLRRCYRFYVNSTPIEQGATMNSLVMNPSYAASDGAVPVYSQRGDGLNSSLGIKRRKWSDYDHEEFYGAEFPQRIDLYGKGSAVATLTFEDDGLLTEPKSSPELKFDLKEVGDTLVATGNLIYHIYDKAHGGDGLPGSKVKNFVARAGKPDGNDISKFGFKYKNDGSFTGKIHKNDLPDSTYIVAVFKDNSEVNKIVSISKSVAIYNGNEVCSNYQTFRLDFQGGSIPNNAKYVWDFGDGNSKTVYVNEPLKYTYFPGKTDGYFSGTVSVQIFDNTTGNLLFSSKLDIHFCWAPSACSLDCSF